MIAHPALWQTAIVTRSILGAFKTRTAMELEIFQELFSGSID